MSCYVGLRGIFCWTQGRGYCGVGTLVILHVFLLCFTSYSKETSFKAILNNNLTSSEQLSNSKEIIMAGYIYMYVYILILTTICIFKF